MLTHFSKYLLADESKMILEFGRTDILFVIDNSGSMTYSDPEDKRLTVVENLVSDLSGDFRYGLVKFTSSATALQNLTNDKDLLKDKMEEMRGTAAGGTAIGDAILNTLLLFDDQSARKVIILLTDGEDYDINTINTAVQNAKQNQVQIFTIGLGEGVNQELLRDTITAITGGAYYYVDNAEQLKAVFGNIGSSLSVLVDRFAGNIHIVGNEIANSGFDALNNGFSFSNFSSTISPGGLCHGFAMSSHLYYINDLPLTKASEGSGNTLQPEYNLSSISPYSSHSKLYDLKIPTILEAQDKWTIDNMNKNGNNWSFNDDVRQWYTRRGYDIISIQGIVNGVNCWYEKPILNVSSNAFLTGPPWTNAQRQTLYAIHWWFNSQRSVLERILNNSFLDYELSSSNKFDYVVKKISEGLPCVISMGGKRNGEYVGHSVLAERVTISSSNPNLIFIEIYDNNHPEESRVITANKRKKLIGYYYELDDPDYTWDSHFVCYLYNN